MSNETTKEMLKFEKNFTDLMLMEQLPPSPFKDSTIQIAAKHLADFDQQKAFKHSYDLFYFCEVICHPYKNEIECEDDDDKYISSVLNHTLKRLIVDNAENTELLTAVRLFHILWLGVNKKALDEQFLINHFVDIYKHFSNKNVVRIVPYSFLEKGYPIFSEEDTKNSLKLALTLEYPELAEEVFK